ncbi:ArsC family (seleno)protein [Planctomyces sp. SH-PL14]|uniref:ArsC family (seleno)protein n=1 Tax=Planctomyces sp. SH-PL14 TaxID=1632864 RepID=UPI00078E6ADD|nr:ArsC family (seleno)protein [Planctomyces sp. SH-PL14]AMV21094.1 ArsC family protein [Planctomyces sp. SH-PL14]
MAAQVDWYYHRKGCKTCSRMDALLEQCGLSAKEVVSANKTKLSFDDAKELVSQVNRIVASKGTKPVGIDLKKEQPTEEELLALLIGPTGNLRAPTIRRGKTLFVGFHEETFAPALGGK